MLPVVKGDQATARQIVQYTVVLIAVTLAPVAFGVFGLVYGVAAACSARSSPGTRSSSGGRSSAARAVRLFHYSLLYLALLFVAMAIDTVIYEHDRAHAARRRSREREPSSSCGARTCAGAGRCSASSSCCSAAPSASRTSTSGCRRRDLDHRAACARRRAAARREGPLRHGRHPDDVRLGGLRRPRPTGHRGRRAAARDGGLDERRQDQPARVRLRRHLAEPALRDGAQPGRARPHLGRLERRLGGGARHRGGRRRRSAPTPAARSGSRPRAAGSPASSRPTGSCRPTASSRSRRASTTQARWRGRRRLRRLLRELVPGFATEALASLEEVTVGVAWLDRCEPLVRARLEAVAAALPTTGSRSTSRPPRPFAPAFMREVGDVHRELYATHSDLYGENIAGKIERCLADLRRRVRGGQQARRGARRARSGGARGLRPAATPTLGFVAPPADVVEPEVRALHHLHVPVQRARLAGAGPAVRSGRGRPAASVQIVGRRGADALVLAAGLTLEGALKA